MVTKLDDNVLPEKKKKKRSNFSHKHVVNTVVSFFFSYGTHCSDSVVSPNSAVVLSNAIKTTLVENTLSAVFRCHHEVKQVQVTNRHVL